MFAHVRVDGRQRVVEEIDVCILVDSAGQGNTLLLASRKVDTLKYMYVIVLAIYYL